MRVPLSRGSSTPAPPPLALPTGDSEDGFGMSQPPLSTPVDQPVVHREVITASPIRTAVKRRRTFFHNSSQSLLDTAPSSRTHSAVGSQRFAPRCHNVPKGSHLQSSYRSFFGNDDDSLPGSSQLLSQRDMPEMSQDTLALFPNIVREHQLMRGPHASRDGQSPSKPDQREVPRRKRPINSRHLRDGSGSLAKASLISTLSGAECMENPFLHPTKGDEASGSNTEPSISSAEAGSRKIANASASFADMGTVLDSDEDRPPYMLLGNPACGLPRSRERRIELEKLKTLKLLLVSSTQGRNFAIDFEQVAVAGMGGFSEVLRAKHRLDGCTYAIKKNLHPLTSDKARLDSLQEVFALSALQGHPNILRYHDAWFEEKGKYLLLQTEFLPEGNLQSLYTDRRRAMPVQDLFAMVSDLSCALSYMHSKGIVHLDIKPDNIFRCNRGLRRESYIVGDFGLSCHVDGYDARSTEGDSRYLCPEALTGNSSIAPSPASEKNIPPSDEDSDRSPTPKKPRHSKELKSEPYWDLRAGDVFSLGASLYELAMGVPLQKSGPQWCALRTETEKIAKDVGAMCGSSDMGHIIAKCLEPDPKKRATALEIRQITQAHDSSRSARTIEQLRKELIEANARIKRYEKVTTSILKSGEVGRQQYRASYPQGAKFHSHA